MKRALLLLLVSVNAFAMETQVLPQGTFMLDAAYMYSTIDKQWNGEGKAIPLIEELRRYEPGAGLQGVLSPRPKAEFDFLMLQLMYGITDRLSVAAYVPIVLRTRVTTNISWTPGDYQSTLGRPYSLEDFWGWAASMGQPRVPDSWTGGPKLADIVIGGRYLLPEFEWMKKFNFRWATSLQVALPTGQNFDPEEAISVGTNMWELHAAGDVEAHLSADKQFFVDTHGIYRINLGADIWYAFMRPREYKGGHGLKNPLLNNTAPITGDTYIVDGGDWIAGTVSADFVPWIGPELDNFITRGDMNRAASLPPMLTFTFSYSRIQTFQSDWRSNSPLWDYDREKYWQPGSKNILKGTVTLSLLRVGVPIQIYARYQAGDWIPGRYSRPANIFSTGIRVIAKFW